MSNNILPAALTQRGQDPDKSVYVDLESSPEPELTLKAESSPAPAIARSPLLPRQISPPLPLNPHQSVIASTQQHLIYLMDCLRDANGYQNNQPGDPDMARHILVLERQLNDTRAYLLRLAPTMEPHLREYANMLQRYWDRTNL